MSTEIATVVGKELAIIEDRRPWHVRAWDSTGCPQWEQEVLRGLRASSPLTLQVLVKRLEDEDPLWAARDPRTIRPAHVFQFAPEVHEAYARRPRRLLSD
jgi:hypothetical protein